VVSGRKLISLPKMPGMAMTRVARKRVAIMVKAKIHWKAIVLVKNCPTPSDAVRMLSSKPMV